MDTSFDNDWDLTSSQIRAVVKLRKLYSNYPDALGTKEVMLFPKEWVIEYLAVYAVSDKPDVRDYQREVLRFCRTRKTITEIAQHLNLGTGFCRDYLLKPLCEHGELICEIDKHEVSRHCYMAVR